MEDPILEALTFALESELKGGNGPSSSKCSNKLESLGSVSATTSSATLLNLNQCIPCIMPKCDFVSTSVKEVSKVNESNFLEHLLRAHHFVIDHVDQIADLSKYVTYWREKFQESNLLDYCVTILMDRPLIYEEVKKEYCLDQLKAQQATQIKGASTKEGDSDHLEDKKFFMITPVLPEDNKLRQKLWNDRLELVLEMNRLEREQTDFNRQCLFCKEVITGNRLNLFQHMADSHSFHIGQPDNVVFINEMLNFIEDKLNCQECIYCGKIFKDKAVLREHMRKKQHKRISPTNGDYDRFYIINYLEPGKTWKILDEEEPEDERREEEWMETKDEETSIVCLFCSFQNINFDCILSHMLSEHGLDFNALTSRMNFYQKVKVVNFIRRNIHQNVCLYCDKTFFERSVLLSHIREHLQSRGDGEQPFPNFKIWDRPEHFFPTYENDQFLILLDRDNENDERSPGNMEVENVSSASDLVVIPEDLPIVCENQFLKSEFSLK